MQLQWKWMCSMFPNLFENNLKIKLSCKIFTISGCILETVLLIQMFRINASYRLILYNNNLIISIFTSPSSIRHTFIRCLRGDGDTYIDFYSIHIRVKCVTGRKDIRVLLPTVDRRGNRLPRFSALSFIRIWCLGQRHYIYRGWSTGQSFVRSLLCNVTAVGAFTYSADLSFGERDI